MAQRRTIPGDGDGRGLDAIELYFREIRGFSLLTAAEEQALGLRVRAGDEMAKTEMIQANLRLAANLARRYWSGLRHRTDPGMGLADFIEHANLGLMKAVERWDPERGFKFSTYAIWWIRQHILRAWDNEGQTIRKPAGFTLFAREVFKTERRLSEALHRDPTDEEIANALNVTTEKIVAARQICRPLMSLDAGVGPDGDAELAMFIPDNVIPADVLAEESSLRLLLALALGGLDDRMRIIVQRRLGFSGREPEQWREIGKSLGISHERVRQLYEEALVRLQKRFSDANKKRRVLEASRIRARAALDALFVIHTEPAR